MLKAPTLAVRYSSVANSRVWMQDYNTFRLHRFMIAICTMQNLRAVVFRASLVKTAMMDLSEIMTAMTILKNGKPYKTALRYLCERRIRNENSINYRFL